MKKKKNKADRIKEKKDKKSSKTSVAVISAGNLKPGTPPPKPIRRGKPVKLKVPDHFPDGKRRAKYFIRKHATSDEVAIEQGKQYILECTLLNYADGDIAEALGVSRQRVSELREEAIMQEVERRQKLANKARVLEEVRILRFMKAWDSAAMDDGNARAAEVMLRYMERLHKIMGLEVNKQEVSGPGGGPIRNEMVRDLTGLNAEELKELETLVNKAEGKKPEIIEGEVVEEKSDAV